MCIIIDASMFGLYCDRDRSDLKPVRKWVMGPGKIAYSTEGKYGAELKRSKQMWDQIKQYRLVGKAELVSAAKIRAKMRALKQQNLKSNDSHIIALAQASGANLLAAEDKGLEKDFTNRTLIKNGKIYKNQSHAHLLTDRRCP